MLKGFIFVSVLTKLNFSAKRLVKLKYDTLKVRAQKRKTLKTVQKFYSNITVLSALDMPKIFYFLSIIGKRV